MQVRSQPQHPELPLLHPRLLLGHCWVPAAEGWVTPHTDKVFVIGVAAQVFSLAALPLLLTTT